MKAMDRKTAIKTFVALASGAAVGAAALQAAEVPVDGTKVRGRTAAARWAVSTIATRYGVAMHVEIQNIGHSYELGGLNELRAEGRVVREAFKALASPEGTREARRAGLTLEHIDGVRAALDRLESALEQYEQYSS